LKILVLTPALYGTAPGQRFRIEQWARHLEPAGFDFEFASFEDDALHAVLYEPGRTLKKGRLMLGAFGRRVKLLRRVRDFDLIYLYREASLVGPAFIERILARASVPIVYDFDDPIWLPYVSPTNGWFSSLKSVGKTKTICRLATVVTVGNRLLAEYARRYASDVRVIPSTIDLQDYPQRNDIARDRPVTLGWTGSHSTLPFLHTIEQPLRELLATSDARLVVIAHSEEAPFADLRERITARRWNANTEAADLRVIDIGLAPFPNTGWTPWRCHGKVLQYMAMGIPVVASRIGIIPDYIQDGANGFLVDHADEWVAKTRLLMNDPDLRTSMGQSGRRTIEKRFSGSEWALELAAVFRGAVQPICAPAFLPPQLQTKRIERHAAQPVQSEMSSQQLLSEERADGETNSGS
jgi:glycosyltransferase involved in cell wall biosynthesis